MLAARKKTGMRDFCKRKEKKEKGGKLWQLT
jgi:hypothetical protein